MELVWLGHSCFRIRGRDATVITDPCPKETGYAIGKQTATIVTVSHDHVGHKNVVAVSGEPRVISGPGEYEISGVLITSIATYHDAEEGKVRGRNVAHLIEIDGVRVCHLGDLGHVPTQEQIEEMSSADVLLVPVGGNTTIDAAAAARTVSLLEPRIIIPMHYATAVSTDVLDGLDRFLKEMGLKDVSPEAKLTVTRGAIPGETRTVVLEHRS